MKKRWKWLAGILVALSVLAVIGRQMAIRYRLQLYWMFASKGLNSKGGDITIRNARVWTGDPANPWSDAVTIRNGKIAALDAANPAGRVVDAGGRLVVPGLWDGHAHPQAPYVLTSPEAPTLFGAKSVEEVLDRLRDYAAEHPEDKFPRLFGWMSSIFKEGEHPTRQMIDAVVPDRPVYLVHHGGHSHWVNTKALEIAGALDKDPPDLRGTGKIERDPKTGLATGFLEETEYAATSGLMLNTIKKIKPYTLEEQEIIQRIILDEYPKVGVTSVWTKDGDIDITRVYEKLLRDDALPVRATLDNMYTPYSNLADLVQFRKRADELEAAGLPANFLRADTVKLFLDLPIKGWIWMFEPYTDGSGSPGQPVFSVDDFRQQMIEADERGLQINISIYGDRALHECLNILEEIERLNPNPPRPRRHMIEHAQYVVDTDMPRFKQLGVIASMNPIVSYPEMSFQDSLTEYMGKDRQENVFQHFRRMLDSGVMIVNGSDFPLAPMDPLVGIHILVNGTDIDGRPKGGLWPHKLISVEEALRTYTTAPAYANFSEDRLGMLKAGYDGDLVILSDDILAPDFNMERLWKVKACLTVLNGHVVHEDFGGKEKVMEFNK